MIDSLTTIIVTALSITAVGIALRPKAPTASVIKAAGHAIAGIQTASYGPYRN